MRTEFEVVAILRKRCQETTQKDVARQLGISPQYLSDLLSENRPISEEVAARLGYRRVVWYEEIEPEPATSPVIVPRFQARGLGSDSAKSAQGGE